MKCIRHEKIYILSTQLAGYFLLKDEPLLTAKLGGSKEMKRVGLISLLAAAVLLSGCLAPSIAIRVTPNSIGISFGQTSIDNAKLTVTTSGFGVNYVITGVRVSLVDPSEPSKPLLVRNYDETMIKLPVIVPFLKETVDIPEIRLDELKDVLTNEELYNEQLKGNTYELQVILKGTKESIDTVNVEFK
jgi:hypothetical protein